MKIIKSLLLCSLLLLISSVSADKSIDWDEWYILWTYDETSETLSIKSLISTDESITHRYSFEVKILDQECRGIYEYSSFQLSWSCDFSIPKDSLESLSKVKIIIINELNEVVEETVGVIELPWYESSFSWDNLKVESSYSTLDGILGMNWNICHDISELYNGYRIEFGSIESYKQVGDAVIKTVPTFKKEFYTTLTYNNKTNCLEFVANKKNIWSIDDSVAYGLRVYDNDNSEVWEGIVRLVIKGEDNDEYINWNTFSLDYIYDREANKVNILVYLPNINEAPSDTYSIEIDKKERELIYDSNKKQLYITYEIYHNRLKNDRDIRVDYVIRWSDYQKRGDGRINIRMDYHKNSYDSSLEEESKIEIEEQKREEISIDPVVESTLSPMEIAVNEFIVRQRVKYPDDQELKDNLILTTKLLTKYGDSKPKYKSIIKELNALILQRVEDI